MIKRAILNNISIKILRAWLPASTFWNNRRPSNNRPFLRRKKNRPRLLFEDFFSFKIHLILFRLASRMKAIYGWPRCMYMYFDVNLANLLQKKKKIAMGMPFNWYSLVFPYCESLRWHFTKLCAKIIDKIIVGKKSIFVLWKYSRFLKK